MRGIQWLTKLILSALITSAVCIASTFWVIQTYVDIVLEQYQLKPMVQSTPSWSQLVSRLSQQLSLSGGSAKIDSSSVALGDKKSSPPADQPVSGSISGSGSGGATNMQPSGSAAGAANGTSSSTGTGASDPGASGTSPQGTGSTGASASGTGSSGAGTAGGTGSGSPAAPSAKDGTPADKNPPEDAIAVFGHQSGQPDTGAGSASGSGSGGSGAAGAADADRRVVVSGEDFTKKKEQLSDEDKNKIFNLLVTRIPQDEMQRISRLMEDGITASELKEIEQVLQKYLKQDEYNQLLGMIKTN